MKRVILGINSFNHDSSVCLLTGSDICFAEEERFVREKHTGKFPAQALKYCLKEMQLTRKDVTDVVFYFDIGECWKNYFSNILTAAFRNPKMIRDKRFYYELVWLLGFRNNVMSIKRHLNKENLKLRMIPHHVCHAWYAYYASQFADCVVLSNDSIGERTSVNAFLFNKKGNRISVNNIIEQHDPHSVGYLYGAVTEFLGFHRGSDEGKVMALASFGTDRYLDYFKKGVAMKPEGRFELNDYLIQNRTYQPKGQRLSNRFLKKFKKPRRDNEKITQVHYDIAYALQKISEAIVIHQVASFHQKNIVLTGGVALNSVINGCIANQFPDKHIFVPSIPNDGGCSIGAAVYQYYKLNHSLPEYKDTTYSGASYTDQIILQKLRNLKIEYKLLNDPIADITNALSQNKVIGIFRGNMESGPRALCNRSIIASPESNSMQDYLNDYVKYREGFRPYGGFILEDDVKSVVDYMNNYVDGPYMSFVYTLKGEWKDRIPSLCHVDDTCRIQIIKNNTNRFLEELLHKYQEEYKIPILINTSLNLAGFPIARTVEDAVMTFACSAMDMMIFNERIVISK